MIRLVLFAVGLIVVIWTVYVLGYRAGCDDQREARGLPSMDDR
jgi:hypothetical protein